jgi:glycosylphosphatidylinositol transamidase (GPIT) subunit GPI8
MFQQCCFIIHFMSYHDHETTPVCKGNNKITELRTMLQRESQNSEVIKQTKSVNNRKTVKTVMTLT